VTARVHGHVPHDRVERPHRRDSHESLGRPRTGAASRLQIARRPRATQGVPPRPSTCRRRKSAAAKGRSTASISTTTQDVSGHTGRRGAKLAKGHRAQAAHTDPFDLPRVPTRGSATFLPCVALDGSVVGNGQPRPLRCRVTSEPLTFQPASALPAGAKAPEFFHLDGEPLRATLAQRQLFHGTQQSAPIRSLLDTRQWAVSGVYLLLDASSTAPPTLPVAVYIGSTKDLLHRVITHASPAGNKPTWKTALLMTGAGVTRGDAYQLERALGDAMTRATTPNVVSPSWNYLPEFSAYDVPWHVRDSFIVLAERCLHRLGISVRLMVP
jgi:predicted GIY-YIG superfamily endonuclease